MSGGVSKLFGYIVVIDFSKHLPQGSEQEGIRPALVLGDTMSIEALSLPKVLVAPITSRMFKPSLLRVMLKASRGGLSSDSTILFDQVRHIDQSRVVAITGQLTSSDLKVLEISLKALFNHLVL
jgi:mRNA interferase MazF